MQNQLVNPAKTSPKKRHLLPWLTSLVLLGLSAVALVWRQQIIDQVTVWQFQPSASLQQIANWDALSDTSKFYLYASKTEVVDQEAFNRSCGQLQNEKTVVLGCYHTFDKQIYVYNVTDPQLDGVKEVTAVHEMLHGAYDRLWPEEKARVDGWLEDQMRQISDQRLVGLIDFYRQTEPGQLNNELHSILGTEVRQLSPELESYYTRYFADRQSVVALKEKYEAVFTNLREQQNKLVEELNSLADDINSRQSVYLANLRNLEADIQSFNRWAQSGAADRTTFENRRASLQDRVNSLEIERVAINNLIGTYNENKAQLEALNLQAEKLNHSIDSKLTPPPSL